MRVVIQRVSEASVTINNNIKSSIKNGLMVLLESLTKMTKTILNGFVTKSPISGFFRTKMM